ncbi:MAG: hypothetical protein JST89_08510 [Cyanobacteria bacterium SZAS-4]|nr:hypothetical protein [Cyanobacteria bacterium SZAS-4]
MKDPRVVPSIAFSGILLLALCCLSANNASFSGDEQPTITPRIQDRALQRKIETDRWVQRQRELMEQHRPPRMPANMPPRFNREDYQRRTQENLSKAQAEYDALKKKATSKADYVVALVTIAQAVHDAQNKDRAAEIYSEAYKRYTEIGKDEVGERKARASLWKHLGYLPPDQFDKSFEQLFKRSLQVNDDEYGMDGHVAQAISERGSWKNPPFDELKFRKAAIATEASIEGANSPHLEYLLRSCADLCERDGQLDEAENFLKRAAGLNKSVNPDKNSASKIHLAEFYVRHKMYAKADQYWPTIKTIAKSSPNSSWLPSEYQRLAEAYLKDSRVDDAEKVLTLMLESSGSSAMDSIDRLLEPMVVGQINNGNLERAQKLLLLRTEGAKRCSDDRNACHWFTKLSEVDLALGQTEESQKIFKRVKIYTALRNGDMNKLVADRQKLVDRLRK